MNKVFGEDTHRLVCAVMKLDPEASEVFLLSVHAQSFDDDDFEKTLDENDIRRPDEIAREVEGRLRNVHLPEGFRMVGVIDKDKKCHYAVVDFSSIGFK